MDFDTKTLMTLIGFAITIFIFVVRWLMALIENNREEIKVMETALDKHMLHVTAHYPTKDEVVNLIGLLCDPIKSSVEDLKTTMKETKQEQKSDINKLDDKLDQLLAAQASRRHAD